MIAGNWNLNKSCNLWLLFSQKYRVLGCKKSVPALLLSCSRPAHESHCDTREHDDLHGELKKIKPYFKSIVFFSWETCREDTFKNLCVLMKRGLIGFARLWTRTTWLMLNPGVHLEILATQTSICSLQETLNSSCISKLEFPEFYTVNTVCWKPQIFQKCLPPETVQPPLRSGHHWHLCQSKLQHSTCDSLNRFPFHQNRPVKPWDR